MQQPWPLTNVDHALHRLRALRHVQQVPESFEVDAPCVVRDGVRQHHTVVHLRRHREEVVVVTAAVVAKAGGGSGGAHARQLLRKENRGVDDGDAALEQGGHHVVVGDVTVDQREGVAPGLRWQPGLRPDELS